MNILLEIFIIILVLAVALFGLFLIICFIPEIESFIKGIKNKWDQIVTK